MTERKAGHGADPETNGQPVEDVELEPVEFAAEEDGLVPGPDDGEEPEDAEEASEPTLEDTLRAERDEFQEKWLRVVAELDNVRKRNRREVLETRRFAQAEVLRSILDVQDNFERALQSFDPDSDTAEPDGFRAGVELIFQKLRGVLKDMGVDPIDALGEEFDPNIHEAVGTLPREGVEAGHVIEVVQQGYRFSDMVLRPSRVIISS
jgi:molecular chaperone GrpE